MNNKIQINAYMKFDDITQGSNLLFEIFFYIFNNINRHEYRMLRAKKGICYPCMKIFTKAYNTSKPNVW